MPFKILNMCLFQNSAVAKHFVALSTNGVSLRTSNVFYVVNC